VTSPLPVWALSGEPAQHRADATQPRLLRGGLGSADEIEAGARPGAMRRAAQARATSSANL
jgi:hypothetical protein